MVAQPQPPRWTVEAYLDMERCSSVRHEFIDGHVYAMAGGNQRHNRICVNVIRILGNALLDRPCRVFTSDMKVRIDQRNFVYSDVTVDCDARDLADETSEFLNHPCLVVEVLSERSTAEYDRGDKFNLLYKRLPSLHEYVLIEADNQGVEVRRRQADDTWSAQRYGAGETVSLASIDSHIPVSDIYL
jgi:Uma2 family endonuclease